MPCRYDESIDDIRRDIETELTRKIAAAIPNGSEIFKDYQEKIKQQELLLREADAKLSAMKLAADEAIRAACEITHELYKVNRVSLVNILNANAFVNEWFWKHQEADMKAGRSFFALIGGAIREVDGTYTDKRGGGHDG